MLRNARLDEAQAGIKIARRNINKQTNKTLLFIIHPGCGILPKWTNVLSCLRHVPEPQAQYPLHHTGSQNITRQSEDQQHT